MGLQRREFAQTLTIRAARDVYDHASWNEIAAPKLHGMSPIGPRVVTKHAETATIEGQSFRETSGRGVVVTTSCRKRRA